MEGVWQLATVAPGACTYTAGEEDPARPGAAAVRSDLVSGASGRLLSVQLAASAPPSTKPSSHALYLTKMKHLVLLVFVGVATAGQFPDAGVGWWAWRGAGLPGC